MASSLPAAAWPQVQELFHAATAATAEERARLLGSDAWDPEVRAYVAKLLAAAGRLDGGLDTPALAALQDRTRAWSAAPSLVGRRLGPYHVVRRVGRGGMGAVYVAERVDGAVSHRVAVKTLWRGADSDVLVRRFGTERQILAGLRHPNIAQFLDAGATEEGTPYLVMEYVEGRPIDEHCDTERLGLTARLDLFRQVCAAVQHAHNNLVVHRDLKPSNVLVTADGQVKLLDFGVAKLLDDPRGEGTLTGAGLSPFTAAFAAPEQVSGLAVSTATDVYALGALLSVLLGGRPPLDVEGLSAPEILTTIRTAPPVSPSDLVMRDAGAPDEKARARGFPTARHLARALRRELDAITLMALRKEPARRYPTVDALSEDVLRYLRRERVVARPDTVAYRFRTFARRRRALVGGMAIAVTSLLAASAISLWQARQSRIAAERSERVAEFLARVTTQDASTVDPIARLGSRGTVSQLLDSLVRRVPVAFPGDERTRARLYAAIGSSYMAQGRLRDAETVLDSAVFLARRAYGPRSEVFASASLEMAAALANRTTPEGAERHVTAALAALAGRERELPELHARGVLGLASTRLMHGAVREADSLARVVVALELARTARPTTTRALAVAALGQTTAWIRRDPRVVDSIYAHAIAISDSMHMPLAFERLNAIDGRVDALFTLGRYAEADSLLVSALEAARIGYGVRSRETAILLARRSYVVRALGDPAAATIAADSAWRIVSDLDDLLATMFVGVAMARITDDWQRGRLASADTIAMRALERAAKQRVPLATTFAALYAGLASSSREDWANAETRLRLALTSLPATGDLNSMLVRIRRPLAVALAELGRKREADSVLALVPPEPAVARCRPGGDWRGC
jgi:serine/threonine-protein kinase